jgi:hypothetical protein
VIENGTWEWNGTVWTERAPATRPPPRIRHTMVWDEGRARCVVYGGTSGAGWLSDVWEWDGTNWTQRSPAPVPAGRESHAAAWDLHRARMVVFGGNASAGLSDETLEYAAPCDVAGAGHPGGGLPLTCLAPPVLGTAFRVAFPSPRGAAWLALAPAPVLAPALAVGPPEFCGPGSIHLAAAAVAALGGDPALFEFPLPAEPALAGVAVVMQGTALQAAGCLRLTDAVIAVLEAP